MLSLVSLLSGTAGLALTASAQYFPPTPEGLTVVHSKHQEGVQISYKEV